MQLAALAGVHGSEGEGQARAVDLGDSIGRSMLKGVGALGTKIAGVNDQPVVLRAIKNEG